MGKKSLELQDVKDELECMINLYIDSTGEYPIDLYVNRDMYKKLKTLDIWDNGTKKPKTKFRRVNIICSEVK